MSQAQSELANLLRLLEPPYTAGWMAYCEKKAEGLARKYPNEYSQLPHMLAKAIVTLTKAEK